MQKLIKVRAAHEVADYIKDHGPDLVISFGHPLPAEARSLVMPLAGNGEGLIRHVALPEGTFGCPDKNKMDEHPLVVAMHLDAELETRLGRKPNILLHCQHGRDRSPIMATALYAGRMLRDHPGLDTNTVLDRIETLIDSNQDDAVPMFSDVAENKVRTNFPVFLPLPVRHYQKMLLMPTRPVANASASKLTQQRYS